MGINTNPGFSAGMFVAKGRPEEFNKLLERQGELVRLIHARKCPCIKNGQTELFCPLCGGKGLSLYYQENCDIYEEYSNHGNQGDKRKVYPFFNPISRVIKVERRLHSIQGGTTKYDVDSFDDTEITLINNNDLPEMFERIHVSYSFRNANSVTNENSIHDGSFIIQTIGTLYDDKHIPTALEVHGDIYSVSRVYNKTKNYTYSVKKFKKNYIYLDDSDKSNNPATSDILEVDYTYIPVFHAALIGVTTSNAIEKWGEDIKIGDIRIVLPNYFYIGRFSIVTAMTTLLIAHEIISRGIKNYDELPAFDVFEIIGSIKDEEGNVYTSNDFRLEEFNNLVWYSSNKPKEGKKYTVDFKYRPTYVVYRDQSKNVHLGNDARYPIFTFARFLNRFSVKDFDAL